MLFCSEIFLHMYSRTTPITMPDQVTHNTRKRRASEGSHSPVRQKRTATLKENKNKATVNSLANLCTSALIQTIATSISHLSAIQKNPEHEPLANYDLVPIFDPLTSNLSVTRWLNRIDDMSTMFHWTPPMTIYAALSRLEGVAKTWYEGLNSVNHTWPEWKELMRNAFPERDYCQMLSEMVVRKKRPDETYMQYVHEKMVLINMCELDEKKAVSLLIDGIEDTNVKTMAYAGHHENPWSLLSYLSSE